jgi:hypothetical protein
MMRRIASVFLVAGLVVALAVPAVAGKKISDSFSATLLPFPKLAAVGDPAGMTKPGCTAGQQDVNWVAHDFTAPATGTLTMRSEGFQGDHDIYVFADDLILARSEHAQVGQELAPPEEELTVALKKKQTVQLVACNWFGQPDVLVNYEFVFKN